MFIVGVIGSGTFPHQERSERLGHWLANRGVHLPLSGTSGTHPLSRNHINILSSDVIVALPGGAGTASELALAERYQRPVVAFLNSFEEIPGLSRQVQVRSDFDEVCKFVESCLMEERK